MDLYALLGRKASNLFELAGQMYQIDPTEPDLCDPETPGT